MLEMPNQIFFVSAPNATATPRERELQQADVRRHAATVAHQRRGRLSSSIPAARRGGRLKPQPAPGPQQTKAASKDLQLSVNDHELLYYRHLYRLVEAPPSGVLDSLDDDEQSEATAALLKAILHAALRMGLRTRTLSQPSSLVKPEYSASFYRAVEYCMHDHRQSR